MVNKWPKTHDELFLDFLTSVAKLTKDIRDRNRELKKNKDYDEITQLHNTKKLISRWFYLRGNLPV